MRGAPHGAGSSWACDFEAKTYIVELEHVLLDLRMSKTYALPELAEALRFNPSYVRMVIRKFDKSFKEDDAISAELAKQVAEKLNREWPPQTEG